MLMAQADQETILIVDDEEPVRRTFSEWLHGAGLECRILTAADAEGALQLANEQPIDLAVLDWALGAGDDGLQLLQDLYAFHPEVVAIMITGFANQATPLDAMRMGVRDYLDKNQDLSKDTFLQAVRKQLAQIRPAKRARRVHQSLAAFREIVEKILPLVQSAAALQDPVPLPQAIGSFLGFLKSTTGAGEAVLLVRQYDPQRQPPEFFRAYDAAGHRLEIPLVPFARSLAGSVAGLQQPSVLHHLDQVRDVELQEFERGKRTLLAAPMAVAPGLLAVVELFDPTRGSFSPEDSRLVQASAEFGAEMLRQGLGQRQLHQLLLDAVAAALQASEQVAASLPGRAGTGLNQPPPPEVLNQLRRGLEKGLPESSDGPQAELSLRLAEAIRILALRHGPAALDHALRLVEEVGRLLDRVVQGEPSGRP